MTSELSRLALYRPKRPLFLDSLDVHRIGWVVVFAYFDETGTSGGEEHLTAVAAYVFSKDGAERFNEIFQRDIIQLLPICKGKRQHSSAKCFNKLTPEAFAELSRRKLAAIKECVSAGAIVAVKPETYLQVAGKSPQLAGLTGNKYSACLIRCIEGVAQWLTEEGITDSIEYMFEDGCNHEAEARQIVGRIKRSDILRDRLHWKIHSFTDKGDHAPWFLAPDMLAWEWQRHYKHLTQSNFKARPEFYELLKGLPYMTEVEDKYTLVMRAMVNMFHGLTPVEYQTKEMHEGQSAFERFREAVKTVLTVRKSDLPPRPHRIKKKPSKTNSHQER